MGGEPDTGKAKRTMRPKLSRNGLHWAIALTISAAFLLPGVMHRGVGRPTALLFVWLIGGAIVRLIILGVARLTRGKVRWARPTAHSKGWSVRYAVIALVGAWALAVGLAYALHLIIGRIPHGIGALVVDLTFLAVLVPPYWRGRLRLVDLGLRRVPGARSAGLVVLGLLAYGLSSSVWVAAVHPPAIHRVFSGIKHESTAVIVLSGFAAAVSAPVVEEIFFRGFLYRSLRNRLPIFPACLIAAVIFGLGHTQYPLLVRPEVVFFGVIACLLYERTGSLLPGIALHSFVDASAFDTALTGNSWIVLAIFLVLATALLVMAAIRALRRRTAHRALPA